MPNGGKRSKAEAGIFKAMGVKPGVPDINLDWSAGGWHGLRIELKRARGGKVSAHQEAWLEALNDAGYLAVVCRGWFEARRVIEDYLSGRIHRQRK